MDVMVSGASGFIGRALVGRLLDRGDTVVALTRNPDRAKTKMDGRVTNLTWSPPNASGEWAERAKSVDAIVNLAGEPIADKRWTPEQKQKILQSRLDATSAVAAALKENSNSAKTLVNGSAVGFYGSKGETILTESTDAGSDFLAGVVVQWEQAASKATESGTRVVRIRSGIVLGKDGGALPRMAMPFRMYGGGVMGPREQWISWIHVDDEVGLIVRCLDDASINGPVNATSPNPVRMEEFSRGIGRALNRPVWAPGLPFVMKLVLGQRTEVAFASQRVDPTVAKGHGYEFRYAELDAALADVLT